jgi:hypothetical protein
MYLFEGTDYSSAMNIPVPTRKWLIRRYNKQKELEFNASKGNQADINKPLNQAQRDRVRNESTKVQSDPARMADFMKSVRNR